MGRGAGPKVARQPEGWLSGLKALRWTTQLPVNPDGDGKGKPPPPQAIALAWGYLFVGVVKPDDGKRHVHNLATRDGGYAGSFVPGPEVGGKAGWEDMPYAVAAMKRQNGAYLVLVEEDWRGKNLVYRWNY